MDSTGDGTRTVILFVLGAMAGATVTTFIVGALAGVGTADLWMEAYRAGRAAERRDLLGDESTELGIVS